MPGTVIGKSLNLGYPGTYSRMNDSVIANRTAKNTIAFGDPVVINADNTYSRFSVGHTAEDFVGIAVRTVKQQTDFYQVCGEYLEGEPTDVLYRGSIIVHLQRGNPSANGKVYIRVDNTSSRPNVEIGGFEADDDGADTVELQNVRFTTGQVDSNGSVEITILTRQA